MRLKNFLFRLFFCLPFIAIVLYARSYHGELVNNAQVYWQYVQNEDDKIYLAMDVYSPSGIKIDEIFSHNERITDSWKLINYPDWYKDKENFEKFSEFKENLHPYLPYNNDYSALYTTAWYTFLYEWKSSNFLPSERSIRIKYQNIGTQNYYNAKHLPGTRVVSKVVGRTVNGPIIDLQILYPHQSSYKYSNESKTDGMKIILYNLVPIFDSSGYVLEDLNRHDYGVSIQDEKGNIIDSLRGFLRWDSKKAHQVYFKTESEYAQRKNGIIDFNELLRHVVAIIFMGYFVMICWG